MINRVVLVGRLTRDPEIRYTQSGVAVTSFTVAVNRQFTNAQGEREADFIGCTIWRKAAENFANFTKKGSLVGIDGRIQTSSYDNQQGERVYRTDVIVENFSLLEKKSDSEKHDSSNSSNGFNNQNSAPNNYNQGSNNYNNQRNTNNQNSYGNNRYSNNNNVGDPYANKPGGTNVSDDDLPF